MPIRHLPARCRPTAPSLRLLCLSCIFALAQFPGQAQDELGNLLGDDGEDDKLLLEDETGGSDLAGLQYSCLLDLQTWQHVRPIQRKGAKPVPDSPAYRWQATREGVSPLRQEPITARVNIPEAGAYRILLRYLARPDLARPVQLTVTPETAGEETPAEPQVHTFGKVRIASANRGRKLEELHPLRLERETERLGFVTGDTFLWEYWDVRLRRGNHLFALASNDSSVTASTLFITQAKAFRPSYASSPDDRTLGRVYLRVRVEPPPAEHDYYLILGASLAYHWRGPSGWGWRGDKQGASAKAAPGVWSPFLELTEGVIPGQGPWSTCYLGFLLRYPKRMERMPSGTARVQIAWYPHEKAVLLETPVTINNGRAMLLVPHGSGVIRATPDRPVWGLWRQNYLAGFQNIATALKPWLQCAAEEVERLGLPDDHPRCRQIRIMAGNALAPGTGPHPPEAEAAAEVLARLGVNRIQGGRFGTGLWGVGASPRLVEKYGLYDETTSTYSRSALGALQTPQQRERHTLHKTGDEITTYVDPSKINADPGQRRAFRAYLAEQAAARGSTISQFFGVEDAHDLRSLAAPPENAGRFQRRLYYHSHRFCHLASVSGYRQTVELFEKHFPNIRVYNNYSPHPVFLTGSTMNKSDWFLLCRNQAQTIGWAEDWVRRGRMSFGFWNVSYYAALVACSARKHGYPSGFYAGLNCGGGARKIFSCVGQGLTWILLYAWGPVYCGADGSNSWSWYRSQYRAAAVATHALGPADKIITEGRREAPRTAILYNRSHEIWQGGLGRLNRDWCWSFIALRQDQVPVDVIIEEDLIPAELDRYDVLFLGGFNLDRQHLSNVRAWLEKDENHLLISSGGALMYDIYGDRLTAAEALFGARQTRAAKDHPRSLESATFTASELYRAQTVNAHSLVSDLKFVLEPTTGKTVARYAGGDCAAVVNRVGKGRALLLGFYPGYVFKCEGGRTEARAWHNEPVLRTLGRQRVEYDQPNSEVTLFEDENAAAVLLTDFGPSCTDVADIKLAPQKEGVQRLSVRCDKPVKSVSSALEGALKWEAKDGRIEIRVPQPDPVDVVILRW